MRDIQRLTVYLYTEPTAATLDLSQLSDYLLSLLPQLQVILRERFLSGYLSSLPQEHRSEAIARLAVELAKTKVRHLLKPHQDFTPLPGEIEYERRRLSTPDSATFGILYDGFKVMHLFARLLSSRERHRGHIHIIFTNQLLGTWEESDRRYHARVSIYGFPSFLSTSGIVEAPAKPREYYLLKQQFQALGMSDVAPVKLDQEFRGRYIDYNDPRLTRVMQGYVMQVIFYHLMGDPFCDNKDCRLYNAHWQEEVLRAQLENKPDFCPYHQEVLTQLRGNMV